MSEQPDGVDERPALVTTEFLERFKTEDPESYDVLFGSGARQYSDPVAALKARAEAAERAVLETWEQENPSVHWCHHCGQPANRAKPVEHTPDCIVPRLLERYAE